MHQTASHDQRIVISKKNPGGMPPDPPGKLVALDNQGFLLQMINPR